MLYDWLIRRRMPLAYAHWFGQYAISWLPNGKFKDNCDWLLHRCMFFVKTANFKVVSNLGKCKDYTVFEIDNFITPHMCDQIVETAKQKGITESTIVDNRGMRVLDLFTRKSKQTWLQDAESSTVRSVSEWVSVLTDMPVSHQEDLQVVAYEKGGYYNPHFDASFHPDVIPNMNRGCGPRLYTFLIYLNDDFEGGETDFPEIGVCIKPKKGKAILFQNIDDHQDLIPESMHAGCPVTKGTKWVANKWVRIWPFELQQHISSMSTSIASYTFPQTLSLLYNNLKHSNSICMPSKHIQDSNVIELTDFVSDECCDRLLHKDVATFDEELNTQLQNFVPIPSRIPVTKDQFFSPLQIHDCELNGCLDTVNQSRFPIFVLYIFLESSDGYIDFPYLQKRYRCHKGNAVAILRANEACWYSGATMHRFVKAKMVAVKYVYTLPSSFISVSSNPDVMVHRVQALSELKNKLRLCEYDNVYEMLQKHK